MNIEKLNSEMIEPLVIGGSILGGGGGGAIAAGLELGKLAFDVGMPKIISIDELNEDDLIVTVSAVGAPAAENQFILPIDYVEAVKLVSEMTNKAPKALITNENGGLATINGLFQSAITGIPILDISCNGRAHPTGVMGSMSLNTLPNYVSIQAAVGGEPETKYRISQVLKGNLDTTSKLVRQSSVLAGGLVAVARNPVTKSYLKNNGALNAISHAYEVGIAHTSSEKPLEKIEKVVETLSGEILARGVVKDLEFKTVNGFDLGSVIIKTKEEEFKLTIWNEYITCENSEEKRVSTFPDLIMTFDPITGMPVTSSELKDEMELIVIHVNKKHLKLGSGMLLRSNYETVESVLKKDVIKYIEEIF